MELKMAKALFYNAKIYSAGKVFHGSFCTEDGWFTDVREEPFPEVEYVTEKVDMQGRFVCPGFNDSHMHLLNYGHFLQGVLLSDHTDSLSGMLDHLRKSLGERGLPKGQWLAGRGWNQDYFTDTDRMPDRWDLDTVSAEVPIVITRACGHCCVVNSAALKAAGITAETEGPEGGAIEKTDGEPNGRLYENAVSLAYDAIPHPDIEAIKEMFEDASKAANSYGITSVQSDDLLSLPGVDAFDIIEAVRQLIDENRLTVRINEQCNFEHLGDLRRFVAKDGFSIKYGNMYKSGPLKMLGDGSLGSRTAKLSVPYPGTDETGILIYSAEEMCEMVCLAASCGAGTVIHAIGDGCLDQVLDSFEYAGIRYPGNRRNGVVHCQVSRADQLERMVSMGVDILAQSIFLDYDNHIVYRLVPKDIADTSYSWKTLLDKGLNVSNGSDCPVELPDVLKGIQCAVTRTSMDGTGPYLPEQAFTLTEALESFTTAGAATSGEEDIKGAIADGMLADFTVLGSDPFETDPYDLHAVKVLGTWLSGKRVF